MPQNSDAVPDSLAAGEVTRLLAAARAGDRAAFDDIYQLVYRELRRIAHGQRGRAAPDAMLSTTALVNEAYLKLVPASRSRIDDRRHFFSLAARAMRQILVDAARRRATEKRGAGVLTDVPDIEQIGQASPQRAEEVVALDAALDRLESLDERLGKLVELRFFAGLSVDEIAELLAVSDRTVKREWRRAKAFLQHELEAGGFGANPRQIPT